MILATALALLLYLKIYKYNYCIDDICKRHHYLTTMTGDIDDKNYYNQRRSTFDTVTNIGVFIATIWYVYLIFGFWPAILFTVFPLNVGSVAWKSGGMYMETCLLIVATHYFVINYEPWGLALAFILYWGALESTVSAIPYAFVVPLITHDIRTLIFFIPLALFLSGKRFQNGFKVRQKHHKNLLVHNVGQFHISRVIIMVKVIGYYIFLLLWPSRLGFFHDCAVHIHNTKLDKYFWSLGGIALFFGIWAIAVDINMAVWFFGFCALYSQFIILGMFTAERYTIIFNVAFCVLAYKFLNTHFPPGLIILATLYFYRSFLYIRAFRNNRILFATSMESFPDMPDNYNNLACWYLDRNEHIQAIPVLLSALKIIPYKNASIHQNLAYCYTRIADFEKALWHVREALRICPIDKRERLEMEEVDLQQRIWRIQQNKKLLKQKGII